MHGVSVDDAIHGIELLFKNDIEASRVAAFIVEPVQERRRLQPGPHRVPAAPALADKHGILIIADEIQTGVARTGKFFAIEHSGVSRTSSPWPRASAAATSAHHRPRRRNGRRLPGGLGGTYSGQPAGLRRRPGCARRG